MTQVYDADADERARRLADSPVYLEVTETLRAQERRAAIDEANAKHNGPMPWARFDDGHGAYVDPVPRWVPERPAFKPEFPPLPEYTAEQIVDLVELLHPLVSYCRHCDRYTENAADGVLARLQAWRQGWIDERTDKMVADWQQSDPVLMAAHAEAMAAKERQEERRQELARLNERRQKADNYFRAMVESGIPIGEARDRVDAAFGVDSW